MEEIEDNAFNYSSIQSITIPNSVRKIGKEAFMGCSLTSVVIPNSVEEIEDRAFAKCSNLTSITIEGNKLKCFGQDVFNQTAWYDSQNDGVTYIGNILYNWKGEMPNNTSITVREGTYTIGAYAFYQRKGLVSIELPNTLLTINDGAFYGCVDLKSLVIPNSVVKIGGVLITGCDSLRHLVIGDGLTSLDGIFSYNLKSLVIGNSITTVGNNFSNNRQLESVTIGNSVVSLGQSAFSYCSQLKSIKLPNSLKSIGYEAFKNSGLTFVVIPNSVTSIEERAFYRCENLKSVILGNSVTNMGLYDFEYCDSLEIIASLAKTPPYIDSRTFPSPCHLLVPDEALEVYKNTDNWNRFKSISTFHSYPVRLKIDSSNATSCTLGLLPMDEQHSNNVKTTNKMTIYGLDPQSTVTAKQVEWTMPDGNYGTAIIDITTDSLTFETLPAQATSNTKAMISAHANGDDDALRFGFEWRRYDAPDLVPSTIVGCPIYEGVIAGTLNGLSSNTYYKYRPIYTSDTGNKYYGEWSAFGTADAYVYFEPLVHTYDAQNITESTAALHGYVVAGSDDVIEQGFEYWSGQSNSASRRTPQNVQTVQASGAMMNVTLTGLLSGTTYYYRTYVKTAKATTYGEERTFTTIGTTGIEESVTADIPTRIFNVYNLSGTLVRQKTTTLEGLPRGMYIINRKKIFVK